MTTTTQVELKVAPRETLGKKVNALRRQGITPANIYGHGLESKAVQVPTQDLLQTLRRMGRTTIVSLHVEGERDPRSVLVHHLQRHSTTDTVLHVDFYEISLAEKIHLEVRVVLTGEAPAVKDYNGIVVQSLDTVSLEALPTTIPSHIEVDISRLTQIDAAVYVRDLTIPEDVVIHADPDTLVVKVEAPRLAIEDEAAEAAAAEEAAEAAEVEAAQEGEESKEE